MFTIISTCVTNGSYTCKDTSKKVVFCNISPKYLVFKLWHFFWMNQSWASSSYATNQIATKLDTFLRWSFFSLLFSDKWVKKCTSWKHALMKSSVQNWKWWTKKQKWKEKIFKTNCKITCKYIFQFQFPALPPPLLPPPPPPPVFKQEKVFNRGVTNWRGVPK